MRSLVAAAAAATAASAAGRGCRHEVAIALEAEDRELTCDVAALARRTGDLRRGAVNVLLEVVPAAATAVLVDGHGLLAAPLHVALHELFGVFLEDVVDLIKELVDVLLDLLALLGDLGTGRCAVTTAFVGLGRPGFLLLLFCHVGPSMGSQPFRRRSSSCHAFILTEGPGPARSLYAGRVSGGSACSGSASGAGTTKPARRH